MMPTTKPIFLAAALLLAGCDMLGIDSAQTLAERKLADGKAVGGACRHSGRALEDCYTLNRKADRAAVFAGWREMNDYMRENNIAAVAPEFNAGAELAAKRPPHGVGETKPTPSEPAAAPAGAKPHES